MNLLTKAQLVGHILRWRLTWDKRDTHYRFTVPDNPKFMGSRDAVKLIEDGAVIATSGLGGNQRFAIMYWAIRELWEETGHPRNITMMCTGGQGGRGKVPGSMEELGREGLCVRLITGHQETFKAMLRLAEQGKLDMQCLPQGILALLIDAQGRGEERLLTRTGVGTFLDPRVGPGSHIFDPEAEQLVEVAGTQLIYRIPKITVAVFGAPAADREGNIYFKNSSVIAEAFEITRAARANNGHVIVNVSRLVEKRHDETSIPAKDIDAIVLDPNCEQSMSIKYRNYWSFLTTQSSVPIEEAIARLRFVNQVLRITPRRTPVDQIIARLAAWLFSRELKPNMFVNIGVGLPEEVSRIMFENGLLKHMTLFTESGVIGGLPAPGVFFGAAACPERMISSAEVFRLCYDRLDAAVLGVVEVDSDGNVNVSKRGEGPMNYVGPGGFIDMITAAKMIIFVTSWMAHSTVKVVGKARSFRLQRIKVVKAGKPKFVDRVAEITFSGKEAVKAGKKVYYATSVGVFQLTPRGMELIYVLPNVDIQKDIVDVCTMKVVLPESGHVPVVDQSIVSGLGFKLECRGAASA